MSLELEVVRVALNADVAQYNANLQQAKATTIDVTGGIGHAMQGVSDSTFSTIESIEGLRSKILVLAGAAGLGELIKSTLETGEQLHHLSEVTGLSTDSIQELGYAAIQTGVNGESLNSALGLFNRNIGQAALGTGPAVVAFKELGIELTNNDGSLRSNQQLLMEAANALGGLKGSAEGAAIAQSLFGRGAREIIPLFAEGSEGLKKFGDAAHASGAVLSEEMVKKARDAEIALKTMAEVISKDVKSAIVELAPYIKSTADGLVTLTHYVNEAIQGWKLLSGQGDQYTSTLLRLQTQLKVYQKALDEAQHPGFFAKTFGDAEERAKAIDGLRANVALLNKEIEATVMAHNKSGAAATNEAKVSEKANQALVKQVEERRALYESAHKVLEEYAKKDDKDLEKQLATLKKATAAKVISQKEAAKTIAGLEIAIRQQAIDEQEKNEEQFINNLLDENKKLETNLTADNVARIQDNQLAIDTILAAHVVGADKQVKLEAKLAEDKKRIDKDMKQAQADALNGIAALSKSKNAEMAVVGKAAAVTQATISTFTAANSAYAAMAGIPIVGPALGAVAAAAAIAAGLMNVSSISGVDIGFAKGADSIPGAPGAPYPTVVHGGERVVTTDSNKKLTKFLDRMDSGGASSPVNINLNLNTDNLVRYVEQKLIERGRIKITSQAS